MIIVAMSDEETIKFLANTFGVSYVQIKYRRKNYHKIMYRLLVTTSVEITQIALALSSWSIAKKEQIEVMLKFLALKESLGDVYVDFNNLQHKCAYMGMAELYMEMKKLNHRGPAKDYYTLTKNMITQIESRFSNH